jgi:thymidylate synthase
MRIIEADNVHCALPKGLALLSTYGEWRGNRNEKTLGRALTAPWPVTTVYRNPQQRVIFWPERDANPFFHLYEALWMLQGRDDVGPLLRYAKRMMDFSDDSYTLHGAYGHRWRQHFYKEKDPYIWHDPIDQIVVIADRLRNDPDDRRCVLQMWDATVDLDRKGRDVPCNTMATFQISRRGCLDLDVFCRSNDIIWGAYGANAVHFSLLLEYVAAKVGVPMGVYRQHSINYHAYEKVFEPLKPLGVSTATYSVPEPINNPYRTGVRSLPILEPGKDAKDIDTQIAMLMGDADRGFSDGRLLGWSPFFMMAHYVLKAHHLYNEEKRVGSGVNRFHEPKLLLQETMPKQFADVDWVLAALQWFDRRHARWNEEGK